MSLISHFIGSRLGRYVIGVFVAWLLLFATGYFLHGSTPGHPVLHVFAGFLLGMLSMYKVAMRLYETPRKLLRRACLGLAERMLQLAGGIPVVMGLCRPSTSSAQQRRIQVFPLRVPSSQEADLPSAGPTLETGFSLDSPAYVLVVFEINQPGQAISATKLLPTPSRCSQTRRTMSLGDTDVDSAIPPVGHDVDPSCHAGTICECGKEDVDGRHKAGHDGEPIGRRLMLAPMGPSPAMTKEHSPCPTRFTHSPARAPDRCTVPVCIFPTTARSDYSAATCMGPRSRPISVSQSSPFRYDA